MTKMFQKIQEFVDDQNCLVFVLIDEVYYNIASDAVEVDFASVTCILHFAGRKFGSSQKRVNVRN